MQTQKYRTLILPLKLLSKEKDQFKVLSGQMVGIDEEGVIRQVSAKTNPLPQAQNIIHLEHHLLCPGLINCHTHLPMVLFRGIGDDLPVQEWLNKIIFPLEKKWVSPEFVALGMKLAGLELIKTGTTSFSDMYFHTPHQAKVLDDLGLRGVVTIDMLGLYADWKKDLEELTSRYSGHKRVRFGLYCHAPYTCKPELLKLSADISQERNLPLSIHVAETKWEIDYVKEKYGKTPVKHLHDLGMSGEHCLYAHCVHLSPEDMDLMAKTKTAMVYNPESNMKLGSGIAPVKRILEKGISVGLGTDGACSNNNLNLFGEMDTAGKLQNLKGTNSQLHPHQILSMATDGGAKALGLGSSIGQIKEGFFADLIAINLKHPHFYPRYDLINHLIFSSHGGEVDFSMCHGKILMENSQIPHIDTEKIYYEVEKLREKISSPL